MASISKKPNSPFWMAKFRDDTGRIVMRSTKQTDMRAARKVAETWEEAALKARKGELTRATALKVLSELVERTTGELLSDATVEAFLNGWLQGRKAVGRASGTVERYSPIIKRFISSMGIRAQKTIRGVTGSDLRKFRDDEMQSGKSAVTANLALKVLKAGFERAKREGLILINPAGEVEALPEDGETRQPFTDGQVQKLLNVANESWRGMVLFGVHTGLRMSDAANLAWENLDLKQRVVSFLPRKTRRTKKDNTLTIALHPDVERWVSENASKAMKGPVFPSLAGRPTGSHTGLSNEFGRLMDRAGIQRVVGEERKGKGRRPTLLSFHSLRHSCVSRLANADVQADVRKTISGHSTDDAHARYTHLSLDTQRRALERVPSLLSAEPANGKSS